MILVESVDPGWIAEICGYLWVLNIHICSVGIFFLQHSKLKPQLISECVPCSFVKL